MSFYHENRCLSRLRIMFFIVPHNPIDVMRDLLAFELKEARSNLTFMKSVPVTTVDDFGGIESKICHSHLRKSIAVLAIPHSTYRHIFLSNSLLRSGTKNSDSCNRKSLRSNGIRPWQLESEIMRFLITFSHSTASQGCHDVIMSTREVTKDTASEAIFWL